MLIEKIGTPAMLEQTAEECAELTQACLKLARYLRGENKVYKTETELRAAISEETADVYICLNELVDGEVITPSAVDSDIVYKCERMVKRMKEDSNE